MSNKSKIIALILGGIAVIISFAFLLFFNSGRIDSLAANTATTFVQEFGTYDSDRPEEYRERTEPYLAQSYIEDFYFSRVNDIFASDLFTRQVVENTPTVKVLSSDTNTLILEVSYTVTYVLPPADDVDYTVEVTLVKESDEWKVSDLGLEI